MSGRILEGDIWGDKLTGAEQARMQEVLTELERVQWAEPLLNTVEENGGISLANQPHLLEARVAHELHRQGVVAEIEHEAGVGGSSVDFRIPGDPAFLVEVVSLRTSEGVKAATWREGYYSGLDLNTRNLRDSDRVMQSEEAEAVVAQGKLGEKVYANKKVTKFPPPQEGTYHVIVADVRGYLGGSPGGMAYLRGDALELLLGYDPGMVHYANGRRFEVRKAIPRPDGSSKLFRGLLEDENPLRAAPYFRERIHAVHFVSESLYEKREILGAGASFLVSNDLLFEDLEEFMAMMDAYPLIELSKARQ